MKNQGFTLIEMIGILPMLTVIALLSTSLLKMAVNDLPAAQRVSFQHSRLNSVLNRIRQDVANASALPREADGVAADASRLLIASGDQCIRYEVGQNKVSRIATGAEAQEWPIDGLMMVFALQSDWPGTDAVSIQSGILATAGGREQLRCANSSLFFCRSGDAR